MALTISTGFVVDDAIVVIENITRHLEDGMAPLEAALVGAKEIGFTVLSMSISLVAVFIPILLMGGIVGRLFREFAVTLSVAIAISMVVSLTTTPMMCAHLLRTGVESASRTALPGERAGVRRAVCARTTAALRGCCGIRQLTLAIALVTVGAERLSLHRRSQGLLPAAGHRPLSGTIQADQDTSFQAMQRC